MYLSNPQCVIKPAECGAGGSWRQKDRTDCGLIELARRPASAPGGRESLSSLSIVERRLCDGDSSVSRLLQNTTQTPSSQFLAVLPIHSEAIANCLQFLQRVSIERYAKR